MKDLLIATLGFVGLWDALHCNDLDKPFAWKKEENEFIMALFKGFCIGGLINQILKLVYCVSKKLAEKK